VVFVFLGICGLLGADLAAAGPFSLPGCNDEILALAVYDGQLVAGGRFTMAGDTPATRIACWDGSSWQPLGSGVAGVRTYSDSGGNTIEIQPVVSTLAVWGGDLVVGGSFTTAGGLPAASIARWDGSSWHAVGTGFGETVTLYGGTGVFFYFPPQIHGLSTFAGDLVAGGLFDEAGGEHAWYTASWNGAAWSALGGGMSGRLPPQVFAVLGVGLDLYAGGSFVTADGTPANNIAGWDGQKWNALGAGVGPDEPTTAVRCLVQFGGNLFAGGAFETAGSVAARNIARWNGSSWTHLGEGVTNEVNALAVFEGALFAGAFRWAGGTWTNALQTNGPVNALAVYHAKLIAAGSFNVIDGRPCQNIGSWPDELTPVTLLSFRAGRRDRAALLRWRINQAGEPLQFHVWREEDAAARVRVSAQPVAGDDRFEFLDQDAPAGAAEYWLQVASPDGDGPWLGPATLPEWTPPELFLAQNRPNPFNPRTTFTFTVARNEWARLRIFDPAGGLVATLAEGEFLAGEHTVEWDGQDRNGREVASGVYLARLETQSRTTSRKITLAR